MQLIFIPARLLHTACSPMQCCIRTIDCPCLAFSIHVVIYPIPHAPPSYCVGRLSKKKKKEKLKGSICLFLCLKFAAPPDHVHANATASLPVSTRCGI